MRFLFLLMAAVLVGCGHLTVAPRQVVSNYPSADGNDFNSGILSCNEKGCLVTPNFLSRHGLHFWNDGVKEGANYRLTAQQIDAAIEMDQKRKNAHN